MPPSVVLRLRPRARTLLSPDRRRRWAASSRWASPPSRLAAPWLRALRRWRRPSISCSTAGCAASGRPVARSVLPRPLHPQEWPRPGRACPPGQRRRVPRRSVAATLRARPQQVVARPRRRRPQLRKPPRLLLLPSVRLLARRERSRPGRMHLPTRAPRRRVGVAWPVRLVSWLARHSATGRSARRASRAEAGSRSGPKLGRRCGSQRRLVMLRR